MALHDTIVAPITAVGGAVALVRLSGPEAWRVAAKVFQPWPEAVEPRRATYGRAVTGEDGLALPFATGSSYTGEESVEISVHGSPASVRSLVEACLRAGARMAEPGEFTLRAFMNGRMDLTQAEGVRDLVAARTEAQLRRAALLREGGVRDLLSPARDALVGALAAVEASTDFSEEVGEVDVAGLTRRIESALVIIEEALRGARTSRLVRHGIHVVIAGRPNAGKSSLLNALVRADRAIVSDIPGTTRDTVEEEIEVDGVPVRLIDTAGLRASDDEIEQLGIERALGSMAAADAVLYVVDATCPWTEQERLEAGSHGRPWLLVANKSDLPRALSIERSVAVSAKTGQGLDAVREALSGWIGETDGGLVNERHVSLLEQASEAARHARDTLFQPVPHDLAAVALRQAVRLLGEVTGETTPPDVIERVFRDFCIGK
ncbi:MAG: tRNA uridine-5-carboxymethylaminomethyl(34) synthesis GTPase MnmE [Fimbriimonadaceae bacterium]|nr:tRNA uridine-5-carboxymethylaminomethyl(34) synthesis GTPase MnmE [Fimbriimonadaceae bacterium]QYK59079.1 MAG: tRNA uridine-5-carboxymethylaminomethyl(34) synthesis GTPase MnmE [Fimbriimonadaceae bacterium]